MAQENTQVNAGVQGKIVQCIGAVVDVEFPRNQMPKVYDALKLEGSALTLEVTASRDDWQTAKNTVSSWITALPQGEKLQGLCDFGLSQKNEGIMTSGTVQYVAKGGNFRSHGYDYDGSLMVLDTILQYGYLWTKIRVQGGAYGAFTRFYDNGDMVFCSYRDPNLRSSVEAYDALADYLESFDVSDREMTKYVIGTLSRIDIPLTPSLRGARAMTRYFTGTTDAIAQQRRDQLLATTAADIRALAPRIRATFGEQSAFEPANLARLYTRVRPGLIRVDADEVTYPTHIMLRYEIEQKLIEGMIEPEQIPELWATRMQEYLGLDTQGDYRNGCLQDIHWTDGSFGYFPSYTLGAMYAAQFAAAMQRELGDFASLLAQDSGLDAIFGWLSTHIWQQASRFDTDTLVRQATGEALNPAHFRAHLTRRYLG